MSTSTNNVSKFLSRTVTQVVLSREQPEGAGARVRRSIGGYQLRNFDPFLMLDEFKVAAPAGFSDHPHRGFETVTYILPESKGTMEHEDFTGRRGVIKAGEVQWMTAGKGIVHAEVPSADGEVCHGLQLWVNLPAADKMKAPFYQEYTAEQLPQVKKDGVHARIIAGSALGVSSPTFTSNPTTYVHFVMDPNTTLQHTVPNDHDGFIYTLNGSLKFEGREDVYQPHHTLTLSRNQTQPEDGISVVAGESGASFVIISGKAIDEPIYQHGPFVMNTKEEIMNAFMDYQHGKNGFENARSWRSEIAKRVHH